MNIAIVSYEILYRMEGTTFSRNMTISAIEIRLFSSWHSPFLNQVLMLRHDRLGIFDLFEPTCTYNVPANQFLDRRELLIHEELVNHFHACYHIVTRRKPASWRSVRPMTSHYSVEDRGKGENVGVCCCSPLVSWIEKSCIREVFAINYSIVCLAIRATKVT